MIRFEILSDSFEFAVVVIWVGAELEQIRRRIGGICELVFARGIGDTDELIEGC